MSSATRPSTDLLGKASCVVGVLLVLSAVAAPLLTSYGPAEIVGGARSAPSLDHLLGTDQFGRDVLTRTLYGGRETLVMASGSMLLASLIGIPSGIAAGYFGGLRSSVTMGTVDVLLSFPNLLFALIVVTVAGAGKTTTIVAVGVAFSPVFARIVYAQARQVRNLEYVAAARTIGCGHLRVMTKHVFPVLRNQIIVLMSSALGWTALLCASLNFLGFGVQPPTAEWGTDLSAGARYLDDAWWMSVGPGVALTLAILAANLIGDYAAKLLDAERSVDLDALVTA